MKNPEQETNITRHSVKILFIGVILVIYGLFRYIFLVPKSGINLSTLQPTIIDGSISLILGLGLLIGGIYSLIYKQKLIKQKVDELNQKKKDSINQPKWLKHR